MTQNPVTLSLQLFSMISLAIATLSMATVYSGAEVLARENFKMLEGKRVGVITNHTAMLGDRHLIDLIHANKKIQLKALFCPEHGLRGLADAGKKIENSIDEKTGVPVFSLYGSTLQPTPQMLEDLDVLIFDIQDVGVRFYTYISTLGLCMQAAAKANLPFIVLDRPNPLGGNLVSGYVLEESHKSFVGQYPVPIQYGLTIGELALMIRGEKFISGLEGLNLSVVELQNWKRSMLWPDTAREWIRPSPNLPQFETAMLYPGSCLFEAIHASEGRGTRNPFAQLGAPYIDSQKTVDYLESKRLPGVKFKAISFTPQSIEGMSSQPRFKNQKLHGLKLIVTDPNLVQPVELGIHLIYAFHLQSKGLNRLRFFNSGWLKKLSGSSRLEADLAIGRTAEEIILSYQTEVELFMKQREPYLLYD